MRKLLLASIAGLMFANSAQATTVFRDRAAFNAAGAGTSTSLDLNSGYQNGSTGPFIFSPLTVTGTGSSSATYLNSTTGQSAPNDSNYIRFALGNFGGSRFSVNITSASAFSLFGFDTRAFNDNDGTDSSGKSVNFLTNLGDTGSFSLGSSTTSPFFGFMFNNPVSTITFSGNETASSTSSIFGTDNYQLFSSSASATPIGPITAAVPEPATWAMMILGFGMVGGTMRRRKSAVTTRVSYAV